MPTGGTNLLRTLSRQPEHAWPDAVIHHGFRVLLLLVIVVLMQVFFPVAPVADFPQYERTDVPTEDLIAEARFTIPKDAEQLAQEREDAAAAVAPIFRYDPAALDTMLAKVNDFVQHLDSAASVPGTDAERRDRIRNLIGSYGFPISQDALDMLADPANRRVLAQSLRNTVERELPLGIVSSADYEDAAGGQWRVLRDGTEELLSRDSVRTQSSLFSRAAEYLPQSSPAGMGDFQRLALILFFEGSLKLDHERTAAAREQARQAVPVTKGEVLRGERVVAAHEQIGERELERLTAYRAFMQASGTLGEGGPHYRQVIGTFLLNLLMVSIFGFLLYFYRPEVYANVRHVLLLAGLIVVLAASAAAVGRTELPVELVPIAFPALIVAVLWDGRLALNMSLVMATLLSIQTPFLNLSSRLILLLGGSAAALSVRVVRRRSHGLVLGLVIALVYAAAAVGIGLLRSREAGDILNSVLLGAANGMASALIAMGFLPLFEMLTRITTDQTLLELTDLNRPLLKRLSLEASGTYAHSINVANLGEAAARAVDANPLLVRVGAYYHDVGKMAMPQYFIENQARGRNPHEQIDPRRSAAIVRAHVAEGMKLAEQAKLPDSVLCFIPEHHGTQTIGFFYDQAREIDPDVNPADFRYQGPRPQSKETAILMLADSVESATKVLQEPTPERIRQLVDRIVDTKIEHGELDEAPLTLRDITAIKEQFAAVLTGMYHHRIDYPGARLEDPRPGRPGADPALPGAPPRLPPSPEPQEEVQDVDDVVDSPAARQGRAG